jgi:hypothetical protein
MHSNGPGDRVATITRASDTLPALPAVPSPASVSLPQVLGEAMRRWIGPVVIALLVFECLIRTFIYSPHPAAHDPAFGWVLPAGTSYLDGTEGFGRVHLNLQGVRGRELPSTDNRGVRRIAVLGDSFSQAAQVDDDQTFCARLEAQLSRRLHQEVWIGNCGRGSLAAADYLGDLPVWERRLHPELVLILFSPGDFRIGVHRPLVDLTARHDPSAAHGSRLISQPPGKAIGASGPLRLLFGCSSLACYGYVRLRKTSRTGTEEEPKSSMAAVTATVAQMQEYFACLQAIAREPIACAYINPCSPFDKPYQQEEEQRLQQATARLRIPFVATGPAFRRDFAHTGQPANGFLWSWRGPGRGHLNATGHQIVAEALAPMVARLLGDHPRGPIRRVPNSAPHGLQEAARP